MFSQQDVSIRLDWVSFTIPRPLDLPESLYFDWVGDTIQQAVEGKHFPLALSTPQTWKLIKSHKPYSVAFANREYEGFVVMYSMKRGEMLIELQGRFCEEYPRWAKQIAHTFSRDVTRLDVAVDVNTDVRPIGTGISADSKTWSVSSSKSGETVYCGSPKSEKMMRVYRYNDPHPRSHLLRSEVVFRRGWAKKLAEKLSHPSALAQFVAEYWRTQKADWWLMNVSHIILDEKAPNLVSAPERRGSDKTTASTLNWLHSQVRPAISRAVRDGGTLDEILDALGLYWSSETTISVK